MDQLNGEFIHLCTVSSNHDQSTNNPEEIAVMIDFLQNIKKMAQRFYSSQSCPVSNLMLECTQKNYSAFMFRSSEIRKFDPASNKLEISCDEVLQIAKRCNVEKVLERVISHFFDYMFDLLHQEYESSIDIEKLQNIVKYVNLIVDVLKGISTLAILYTRELDQLLYNFVNKIIIFMTSCEQKDSFQCVIAVFSALIPLNNVRSFIINKIAEIFENMLEYLEDGESINSTFLDRIVSFITILDSCNSHGYQIDKIIKNNILETINKLSEFLPKLTACEIKNSQLFDDIYN